MDLKFCADAPKECVTQCGNFSVCMTREFCAISQIEGCSTLSVDCSSSPDMCRGECAEYAPCFACSEACDFDGDGECDDGGDGAAYSACPRGSDCADCGLRVFGVDEPPSPPPLDTCAWMPSRCVDECAEHVECLQFMFCALSTEGCGHIQHLSGACSEVPRLCILQCGAFASCMLCTDSCDFDGDGDCDDGGSGSEYSACPTGSDCADCGPRGRSALSWSSSSPPMSPPTQIPPLSLPPPVRPPQWGLSALPLSPPLEMSHAANSNNASSTGWIVAFLVLLPSIGLMYYLYRRKRVRSAPLSLQIVDTPLSSATPYTPPI